MRTAASPRTERAASAEETITPRGPAVTTGYQTHRNLPPLAGLCSFAEADRAGLSVEESVRRLKRHHYALRRIHGILPARITACLLYTTDAADE